MNKDLLIKILLWFAGVVILGMSGWLLTTVYNNSKAITTLVEKKQQDQAQWEAIKELRKYHMN